MARARRRWMRERGLFDPARLVFIDETAANTNSSANIDPFMLHIYAALAQKERALISERTKAALGRKGSGDGFGQPSAIGSCRTRNGRWKEPRRSVCCKSAAAGSRNPKSRGEQLERHSRRIEQAGYSDCPRQGMDSYAGRPCSPAGNIVASIQSHRLQRV